jgi:hypothetical protein
MVCGYVHAIRNKHDPNNILCLIAKKTTYRAQAVGICSFCLCTIVTRAYCPLLRTMDLGNGPRQLRYCPTCPQDGTNAGVLKPNSNNRYNNWMRTLSCPECAVLYKYRPRRRPWTDPGSYVVRTITNQI